MANETFNAEAARRALTNARQEIEQLVRNFENTRSNVAENFDQNAGTTAALGGALGATAQQTFEQNTSSSFDRLSANMSNFIDNRVETIIKNSMGMEEEARSVYGGN